MTLQTEMLHLTAIRYIRYSVNATIATGATDSNIDVFELERNGISNLTARSERRLGWERGEILAYL